MLSSLRKMINGGNQPVKLARRQFPNKYFRDESAHDRYVREGYVLLKGQVSGNLLDRLRVLYEGLTALEGYAVDQQFVNSGRFASPEIRSYVMEGIGGFSGELLPRLFDSDVFDENTTGAFQIKPPSKKSALNPHQDSPVIDETRFNAMFVWIPLCDITRDNGPVWVLPGSHLWGNHQRSLNVPWPFEKHTALLWKHMHPIEMQAGDVLCWDTALIHGSTPNMSGEIRVAVTTTLLPKDFSMVEYFLDRGTHGGLVEKYRVGRGFWESGNIMDRPPCPPNTLLGKEPPAFPQKLTRAHIRQLIRQIPKNRQDVPA